MSDENTFDLSKISVTDPDYAKCVFATIAGVYNELLNCKDFMRSNSDGKVDPLNIKLITDSFTLTQAVATISTTEGSVFRDNKFEELKELSEEFFNFQKAYELQMTDEERFNSLTGKFKDYLGSMYDLLIAKGYNVDSPF